MKRFLHLQFHTTGVICAGIWTILAQFSHTILTTSVRTVAEIHSCPTIADIIKTETAEVNVDLQKSTYIFNISTEAFKHWMEGDYMLRGVKNAGDDLFFLTTGSVFDATENFCVIPDRFLTAEFSVAAEDFSVQRLYDEVTVRCVACMM